MLVARGSRSRAALAVLASVAACGYPSVGDLAPTGGAPTSRDAGARRDAEGPPLDPDAAVDPPDGGAPPATDTDNDGAPDDQDCDPLSTSLGLRVVEDALSTDKGHFAAADGFVAGSWAYQTNAYRQTRLDATADLSFFVRDGAIGNVSIEIVTASTEVSAAITPKLRQIFVVLGAKSQGGQVDAHACGIEVVEGQAPEQKTSVVRLGGTPSAVTTTALDRVARAALQVNEEISIRARLEGGTLTCVVTQAGVQTTAQANVGALTGSVGLFTRQSRALFKTARVCKLR